MNGFTILGRNLRAGGGEIDLVAREGPTLVFVEVRLRGGGAWVGAGASIGRAKWGRIRSCARVLAAAREFCWPGRRMRIDAIVLGQVSSGLRLEHLRNLTGPSDGR
jgi:putative endonuclease